MRASTAGRAVDAGTLRSLRLSYASLVKAGNDSVRAAWRFGQNIDSHSDSYTRLQLADAMDLSVTTLARYIRLYNAYERPELAVEASDRLETYNIDTLAELARQLDPVEHGRPLAGRKFRYRCHACQSLDIGREEYEPDPDEAGELVEV